MNSKSTIRLLAIFVLTLSMAAVAGTTNVSPTIHLARADYITGFPAQNSGTPASTTVPNNQWVPAGPMVDKILDSVFADQNGEFTALKGNTIDFTDWTLGQSDVPSSCPTAGTVACDSRFWVNQAQGNSQIAGYGMFGIDFNNANTFFGINFGYGKDTGAQASQATDFRQAVAHLIDRQAFVSSQFGSLGQAMDNPIPPGQGFVHSGLPSATDGSAINGGPVGGPYCINESTAATHTGTCGAGEYSISGACNWDTLNSQFVGAGQTCTSAFHYGGTGEANTNGIVNVGTTDYCDAAQHLFHAGLATGVASGTCNLIGFAPLPGGTTPITFIVRSDDPVRENLGNGVAADLCTMIHGSSPCPEVSVNLETIQNARPIVFATDTVHLDWHMYTLGWGLGATPEQVWSLYNSAFASNACGGVLGPFGTDYAYICNPTFDHFNNMIEFNATNAGAVASLNMAADIFGSHAFSLDIYAQNDVFAYRKEWSGVVMQKGIGTTNPITQLNAWSPTPAASGELREGFKQGTSNPNPYSYTTQWEFQWNGQVYDSLISVNPYSPTDYFGWMVNQWQILGPQPGDPAGTVQDVKFNLRNDIFFHDGKQVTASDYMFSWQTFANTGGLLNANTPQIVGVRIQNDFNFIVNTNSLSVFQLGNIGGLYVMPQHILAADTTTKCTAAGTPACSLAACTTCPSGAVDTADLVQTHQFIGSGPYKCIDIHTSQIGGGCSDTGTGSTAPGNTITLTRDGYGQAGTANSAYFRDSAKYKQWEWSDIFHHGTVDITDVSSAAACLGKAASSSPNCGHWDSPAAPITCVSAAGSCNSGSTSGLGGNNGGTVTFLEIQQAFRWFGVSWTSPLTYASLSSTTGCGGTGCGAQSSTTQTVYEGGVQYGPYSGPVP